MPIRVNRTIDTRIFSLGVRTPVPSSCAFPAPLSAQPAPPAYCILRRHQTGHHVLVMAFVACDSPVCRRSGGRRDIQSGRKSTTSIHPPSPSKKTPTLGRGRNSAGCVIPASAKGDDSPFRAIGDSAHSGEGTRVSTLVFWNI